MEEEVSNLFSNWSCGSESHESNYNLGMRCWSTWTWGMVPLKRTTKSQYTEALLLSTSLALHTRLQEFLELITPQNRFESNTGIVQPELKQIINVHAPSIFNYNLQELLSWSLCADKFYKIGANTVLSVTHGGRKMEEGWKMVASRVPLADKWKFNTSLVVKSLPKSN